MYGDSMKITLIIPYFGKKPEIFSLWMKSAGCNTDIDFLVFTDFANEMEEINKYRNIRIVQTEFNSFAKLIQDKMRGVINCKISMPYKLCDYRPAYGYCLSEYIRDCDYWGYCDMDLVFGRISKFIQAPILSGMDKVYRHGHLTLFRNNQINNELFLQKTPGIFPFAKVAGSSWSYHFDENGGINKICSDFHLPIYDSDDMADIDWRYNNLIKGSDEHTDWCDSPSDRQVYVWNRGTLYECRMAGEDVQWTEKVYVHLQKRKLKIQNGLCTDRPVIITPMGIFNYEGKISPEFIQLHTFSQVEYTDTYLEYQKKQNLRFFDLNYIMYKLQCLKYR